MASAFGLPQIASLYDPNVAVDQQALDRQMALAQALRLASMAPVDTSNRQIGGVGYRVSPWEGMAKILQSYKANTMEQGNDQARLALSQKYATALRGAIPGGPSGDSAPAAGGTPAGVPSGSPGSQSSSGGVPSFNDLVTQGAIEGIGGSAVAAATAKRFEPMQIDRELQAAGIDPNSQIGRQYKQSRMAKENYIPPSNIRPGGYTQDPVTGAVTQYPQVPAGNQATPDGRGGFAIAPVPGGMEAIRAEKTASAMGTASAEPYQTYDDKGNPNPIASKAAALAGALRGNPAQVPPQTQAKRDVDRVAILQSELNNPATSPADRALIQKEIGGTRNGQAFAVQPLGTEAAQKGLDTSWEALKGQSREANNTKSYLDNIVTAAEKGAISGPQADRREMIAGILQLAGIKESVNTNATTQTQLLDKYHNQIVTRLGQNGLGTDAARALLDSAYPGKAMNLEAIREASSNLKGAMDMTQAKARFLQDSAIKRDTTTYQQRELSFDQAADPRIWQGLSMKDAGKRKAFMEEVYRQDPSIKDRILKLKELGIL
jgi:hypothetical protein